jgi:hypothetical protein
MRHNRAANGHSASDLDVVRATVPTALPALIRQLPTLPDDANNERHEQKGGDHD